MDLSAMIVLDETTVAVRLGAAALLGGLIGLERELYGRPAGLRTQLLVALGAALAMVVSLHFAEVFGDAGEQSISVDPARLAYGVMAGVGFLGAGEIIHSRGGVQGLTTAASLWCTAAIGLASGFGMYFAAAVATGMALFALRVLNRLDRLVSQKINRRVILHTAGPGRDALRRWRRRVEAFDVEIVETRVDQRSRDDRVRLTFVLRCPETVTVEDLLTLEEHTQPDEALSVRPGRVN